MYVSILFFLTVNHYCGQLFFFSKKQNKSIDESLEEEQEKLLCKFVQDGSGKIIGESLSIDDDLLIIKSKERFLGIPLKHVQSMKNTLLVKGLIDLDKALEMGEEWLKTSYNKNSASSQDTKEISEK